MKRARDYQKDLIRDLKEPQEAVEYLNAALEEEDPRAFLIALRNVVEARCNVTRLAKECKVTTATPATS
jgi:DNA-binding phage protein